MRRRTQPPLRGSRRSARAETRRLADNIHDPEVKQTLLKIAAPGGPDLYQGTELWDFSLVDPDNRRPVDYAERQRLLK